ncbi:cell division protein/peptidoglycan transpeptidase FtsI [Psychroflexus torquis ATCC 700755]|uniref:Cell division protein/peptidoglycan transpeptidase FtsI n=1 Tax=Psychroflexus torquis (strain ATCC 700755 / CIP 106069 / ACAM 623) TaxID=313595 RepID=K4IJ09_PSYTT|nr:penicillin-binding protein [Psychroflexus torquis]AFU69818.1 cell division protein/peptidoglycan transpeptidase FtsI [Psychroflexus torquis ATCC 700755]
MTTDKSILRRFYIIAALLALVFMGMGYKLFDIQIVEGQKYKDIAQQTVFRNFNIEPNRGNLYDTNMNLLATSVPKYDIRFDAITVSEANFQKYASALATELSKMLKGSKDYYLRKFKRARVIKNRYVLIAKQLDYSDYIKIREFPLFNLGPYKGGFIAEQSTVRENPLGKIGERTVGFGNVGLEGAFDEYLKGKQGHRLKQKIAKGQWKPISDVNEVEPEDGYDVVSTIDVNIQDVAHHALLAQLEKFEADHGSVVVMETKTGEIKAISNLGRIKNSTKYYEKLNYAVYEPHEPGSIFKLMSMAAALEDRVIDTSTVFDTEKGVVQFFDRKVYDSKRGGYGKISAAKAFEVSSNTAFAKMIYTNYKDNPERFVNRLYNMGLNEKIGLKIKGEGQPTIPHPEDSNWYGTTLPWMSFGYGVSLTSLQILTFYNAIANDGVKIKPKFIKEVRDKNTLVESYVEPILEESICSKETAKKLQAMMKKVVEKGTGSTIYNPNFSMAGKTGTCQTEYWIESGRYVSSFVGYFPADAPTYSCVVVIHKPNPKIGYYGSTVAAPVFEKIAQKIFIDTPLEDEMLREAIPSNYASSTYENYFETSQKYKTIMPDLTGYPAMDAVSILENLGLQVNLIGQGKVIKQSIKKGTKISNNQRINLISS